MGSENVGNIEYRFIAITSCFTLNYYGKPARVTSMAPIDMFENYSYQIEIHDIILLSEKLLRNNCTKFFNVNVQCTRFLNLLV